MYGVLTHAYEVSTADNLLNPFGWIKEVHESTHTPEDYSSFMVKAWCFSPELLPPQCNLVIVEPLSRVEEVPPMKRALVYPILLAVHLDAGLGEGPLPPPAGAPSAPGGGRSSPRGGHDSDNSRSRMRRRMSASSPSRGPSTLAEGVLGLTASGEALLVAVVDASDPTSSGEVLVVATDDASNPIPVVEPRAAIASGAIHDGRSSVSLVDISSPVRNIMAVSIEEMTTPCFLVATSTDDPGPEEEVGLDTPSFVSFDMGSLLDTSFLTTEDPMHPSTMMATSPCITPP